MKQAAFVLAIVGIVILVGCQDSSNTNPISPASEVLSKSMDFAGTIDLKHNVILRQAEDCADAERIDGTWQLSGQVYYNVVQVDLSLYVDIAFDGMFVPTFVSGDPSYSASETSDIIDTEGKTSVELEKQYTFESLDQFWNLHVVYSISSESLVISKMWVEEYVWGGDLARN
jgi:hypothetical protein